MRTIQSIISVMLMLVALPGGAWAAEQYPVYMQNNAPIAYGKVIDGSIYVPLRPVFTQAGAKVEYVGEARKVCIWRSDGAYLELAVSNEQPRDKALISVVAEVGRTYVPLRLVGEWLNYDVNYTSGKVQLDPRDSKSDADTLLLPAGNLNCNLLNNKYVTFWQDHIHYWCSLSDTLNRINGDGTQTEVARGSYHSFNIWQNDLYAVYDGKAPYNGYDLVRLNSETFLPEEKLLDNIEYCKIQDGWIYFRQHGMLYRRLVDEGEVEELGFANVRQIIITDQHIFANIQGYDGAEHGQIWMMNLDGSGARIVTAFADRYVKLLDYADGYLYLNIGCGEDAGIWCMKQNGAGLTKLVNDGALELCVFGDWLYYGKMENGPYDSRSSDSVWRVKRNGQQLEKVSPDSSEGGGTVWDEPVILDGRLFYREAPDMSQWHWIEVISE